MKQQRHKSQSVRFTVIATCLKLDWAKLSQAPICGVSSTHRMEKAMLIETDKARAAVNSPRHAVLKMLIVSTSLSAAALATIALIH